MKWNAFSRRKALGLVATVTIALLSLGSHRSVAETVPSSGPQAVRQAYKQLLSAKVFAFGGVGFAGTISEPEKAFHIVAADTNALEHFSGLLRDGSGAAQLYGLCGIRGLAPKTFDNKAKPIIAANPKVNTMAGCLMAEEAASDVVARIALGRYDPYISRRDTSQ